MFNVETPFYAFSQILCASAGLSLSPTYGEILALRHNYDLDEEDLSALGLIIPALRRIDAEDSMQQNQEARASAVCLKIFSQIENAVFVFEDAHWIDSQTWVLMQMLLGKMSLGAMVLIVTRPPTMESQLRGGGNEGLGGVEEEHYADGMVHEDDRIKFSRILKGLKESSSVSLLSLGPLNKEATTELVAASLETTPDKIAGELLTIIQERCEGVPMYVRSFSAYLDEKNLIARASDGAVSMSGDAGSDLKFPDSLVATVLERFDAIDDASRRVVKIAACFGFEFVLAQLKIVCKQFLPGDEPLKMLDAGLVALAKRQMIVRVQEARTETHLKFTHQIICETAYSMQTESQRQAIHAKIASVLDNSTKTTKNEILAHHYVRANNHEKGCELLYFACRGATKLHAYKEAYNSVALGLAHVPNEKTKFIFISAAACIKHGAGEQEKAAHLALDALELYSSIAGENWFLPNNVISKAVGAQARRDFEELPDVFPEQAEKVETLEGRMQVAFTRALEFFVNGHWVGMKSFVMRLVRDYGFQFPNDFMPGTRTDQFFDFVSHKVSVQAYEHGLFLVSRSILSNMQRRGRALRDPEGCKFAFKRLMAINAHADTPTILKAVSCATAVQWYTPLQPAFPSQLMKNNVLRDYIQELSTYEIRRPIMVAWSIFNYYSCGVSVGQLLEDATTFMKDLKVDTEALDETKFIKDMMQTFMAGIDAWFKCDDNSFTARFHTFQSLPERYPKLEQLSGFFPIFITMFQQFSAQINIVEGNWEAVLEPVRMFFSPQRWMIYQSQAFNSHLELTSTNMADVLCLLLKHYNAGPENVEVIKYTNMHRGYIEHMQKISPGSFRCAGAASVAKMSALLLDRDLTTELEKMQAALTYATDLTFLPVDQCVLQLEIAIWTGDTKMAEEARTGFERMGFIRYMKNATVAVNGMQSGKNTPIDLNAGVVPVEKVTTTIAEQIAAIEKTLVDLKLAASDAYDNDDDEEETRLRKEMRQLKSEKKLLLTEMKNAKIANNDANNGDSPAANAARIKELRKLMKEKKEAADVAFEEDDDEAEERIRTELKQYKKELVALGAGTSRSRSKLEQAKKLDAQLSEADLARIKQATQAKMMKIMGIKNGFDLVFGHETLQSLRLTHKGVDEMLVAIEANGPMAAMGFQEREDIQSALIHVMPAILDEVIAGAGAGAGGPG